MLSPLFVRKAFRSFFLPLRHIEKWHITATHQTKGVGPSGELGQGLNVGESHSDMLSERL